MKANWDTSRRLWAATALLLAAGLAGHEIGFACAVALSVMQMVLFRLREGSLRAFPVQVRVAYTALLYLAILDTSRLLAMAMLTATSVRVLLSYCLLARCLSLLPWNRTEPLSLALALRTFLAPTMPGATIREANLPPRGCSLGNSAAKVFSLRRLWRADFRLPPTQTG